MEILVSIVTIKDLEKVTWTAPDGRAMEAAKRYRRAASQGAD